jgi:tyrosyl-tRNA synthetase
MDAKKRLAYEITKIYHSAEEAQAAKEEFERVFSQHELPTDIPEVAIPKSSMTDEGIWAPTLIVTAGMAGSNSEARRLIQQGAVTLDGERITNPTGNVQIKDGQILKAGKLKFGKLKIVV